MSRIIVELAPELQERVHSFIISPGLKHTCYIQFIFKHSVLLNESTCFRLLSYQEVSFFCPVLF